MSLDKSLPVMLESEHIICKLCLLKALSDATGGSFDEDYIFCQCQTYWRRLLYTTLSQCEIAENNKKYHW